MPKHSRERAFLTPEVAQEILRRLMDGESLRRICGPDRGPHLPDRITVHERLRSDKAFRLAYLLAKEAQAETFAQEMLDIADGRLPEPGQVPNVSRDRLRVQTRKWLAEVMAPRRYGRAAAARDELAELEAATRPMGQMERAARIAAILETARRRRDGEEEPEGGGWDPRWLPPPQEAKTEE